jgi:MoaA/NifB/PqqE/SkfB family radical SAM enzyme
MTSVEASSISKSDVGTPPSARGHHNEQGNTPIRARTAPPPESLVLDWTDYCNAKCFFCPRVEYEQQIGGKGGFVPFEDLKKLEKVLRAIKYFSISSAIGEPLLHPELEQIFNWLYEINPTVKIRTTTNGTALTGEKSALFAGHLDWLSVSLNASNAQAHIRDMFPHLAKTTTDVQKRWELHLRHLKEFIAGLPEDDRSRVRFQMVTHRDNLKDLAEFVRVVHRIGGSHAVVTNIGVHGPIIDSSLYWVKDEYNDAVDEAVSVGSKLGVVVSASRFFTSVKPVLDLDKVCRDPIDIAYISKRSVAAPCCQWSEAAFPIDVYNDEKGFERYWNSDVMDRLRQKRNFSSCQVCGLSRVFDETSFHFSPNLKLDLLKNNKLSKTESEIDFPDAQLVRTCVENRIDVPTLRRCLRSLGIPMERLQRIQSEGPTALAAIDRDCWESFKKTDSAGILDLDLASHFLGVGWGPQIHEPKNRISARWVSAGNCASVYTSSPSKSGCEIRFTIHNVHPVSLIGQLKIAIGDQILETRHLQDKGGRDIIAAWVPNKIASQHDGRLWIRVGCLGPDPAPADAQFSLARLEISDTKMPLAKPPLRARTLAALDKQIRSRPLLLKMARFGWKWYLIARTWIGIPRRA